MKLKVNLSSYIFFAGLIGLFIIGGSFVVFAFGGNNPVEFGHSGQEIEIDIGDGNGLQSLDTILNLPVPAPGSLDCEIVQKCFRNNIPLGACEQANAVTGDIITCDASKPLMMGGSCIDHLNGSMSGGAVQWGTKRDYGVGSDRWYCETYVDTPGDKDYTISGVCCDYA